MEKESEKNGQAEIENGQRISEAIVKIAEKQLEENSPPDTKITLDRLMAMGESREKAIRHIASVLSAEVFEMMKDSVAFNEQRYVEKLKALPEE